VQQRKKLQNNCALITVHGCLLSCHQHQKAPHAGTEELKQSGGFAVKHHHIVTKTQHRKGTPASLFGS